MSAVNTLFQNVTAFESSQNGFADIQQVSTSNLSDCTNIKNNTGKDCSFDVVNGLFINSKKYGVYSAEAQDWLVSYTNSIGGGFDNYFPNNSSNTINSISIPTTGIGLGQNECMVYVPDWSNMKGAGEDGEDIGANIIYRYENGTLTNQKLWNESTGQFPCGAIVNDVNDDVTFSNSSCINVHKRVNVGVNGCPIP